MAKVIMKNLGKSYENGFKAVKDFNLNIDDGEFVVLVGPSGCGKSTTLRMIAGLEEISSGGLYIDDKIVNNVEPVDRDIAMVFQNYALYPHFSVYENMAFADSTASLKDVLKGVDGKFQVGTAYMPKVNKDDKGGVSIGGGSLWVLDKNDEVRQKAAFEFIKFMVEPEEQVYWNEKTGYFPVTTKAYDLDEMKNHLAESEKSINSAIEKYNKANKNTK